MWNNRKKKKWLCCNYIWDRQVIGLWPQSSFISIIFCCCFFCFVVHLLLLLLSSSMIQLHGNFFSLPSHSHSTALHSTWKFTAICEFIHYINIYRTKTQAQHNRGSSKTINTEGKKPQHITNSIWICRRHRRILF